MDYPIPKGVCAIPEHLLDLRSDSEIDKDIVKPKPISDEKNIWFFWHSGFRNMHPYAQRNIRAWHRRFSRQGWVVRVLDRAPSSPLNVSNFLDITDPGTFPQAFVDGTVGGDYAPQHTSDLVRFPLLIKYGGVYADVGLMQIGDLDALWNKTVGDSSSPYEVLSFNMGGEELGSLANYFLASQKNNALFERCHRLFLKIWEGKSDTEGLHKHPLLKGVPFMKGIAFEENGRKFDVDEVTGMLTDYIIQGQCISMVMGLVDDDDGWNGPEYVSKHIYAPDAWEGSQLINNKTAWDGRKAFELMSLLLPAEGETESAEQAHARDIVEDCLSRSFSFKLAHGLILRVLGPTLGSQWRKHEGSDNVPGTYAHWLRHGTMYWAPKELPAKLDFKLGGPLKRGPLLREV